jgi:hypothetical protein
MGHHVSIDTQALLRNGSFLNNRAAGDLPRFMSGAVMVQVVKHDMENMDNMDRCSAIGGTTRTLYHHMYCKDTLGMDFESGG